MVLTDVNEISINNKLIDISGVKTDVTKIQELFRAYVQDLELQALQKDKDL